MKATVFSGSAIFPVALEKVRMGLNVDRLDLALL